MQRSTAARDAANDSFETTVGTSPVLRIYTGAAPANPAAAATGTLIASIPLPSDWLSASSAGVKSLLGTWSVIAAATGSAGYYRIWNAAISVCHEQGSVSYTAAAWAISTAYNLNDKRSANGNVYNCSQAGTSAATGTGPSTTGTAITDNTAKWDYVSAIPDMGLDNIAVQAGQTVAVTSYSFTASNP